MLSGHGYFHKMGKTNRPVWIHDDNILDDAEHTIFECDRWGRERYALEQKVGIISSTNIISIMLYSREYWTHVAVFVESILRMKKQDLDEYYTLQ